VTSSSVIAQAIESVTWLTDEQAALLGLALAARPGAPPLAVQQSVTLFGPYQPELVDNAVQLAVRRHPTLRTAIVHRGVARPVQVVLARRPVPVSAVDLRGYDAISRGRHAAALADAELARPFDLQAGPLLRATLVRQAQDQTLLLWTASPLIADPWSWSIVTADFLAYYERLLGGAAPESLAAGARALARRGRQFHDWARDHARRPAATGDWAELVRDAPAPTRPPALTPRQARPVALAGHEVTLDPAEQATVAAAVRQHGLPLSTYVQAAWGLVLQRAAGRRDAVFAATRSGRPDDTGDVASVTGAFGETIPVRVTSTPDDTVGDYLGRADAQGVAALQRPRCDLAAVAAASGLGDDLAATLFGFEVAPPAARALERGGLVRGRLEAYRPPRRAACQATATADADRLKLWVGVDAPYVRRDAERILDWWRTALGALAAPADRPLDSLDIIPAKERRKVVDEFNAAAFEIPEGATLATLVAGLAEEKPYAPAILAGGRTLNRREFAALVAEPGDAAVARTPEGVAALVAGLDDPGFVSFALNPALDALFDHAAPAVVSVNDPAGHDFVLECIAPLARGVPLVLPDEADLADAERFAQAVWTSGGNVFAASPDLLAHLTSARDDLGFLTGVQRIVVAGPDYPAALVARLAMYTPATWFRAWTPAGQAVWATLGPIAQVAAERPDLGRPLANLKLYVLDGVRPCGIGQVGDLSVAGALPGFAAARTVANPLGPGQLIRTGDRVRWLPDGQLDYVGTRDVADEDWPEPSALAAAGDESPDEPLDDATAEYVTVPIDLPYQRPSYPVVL
jgi:non-ribosomal peptide synthetase component F